MKKIFSLLLILLLLTTIHSNTIEPILFPDVESLEQVKINSVIDGDTISTFKYDNNIRLIGIDAPETKSGSKPMGEYSYESYQFVKNKLLKEANRNAYLEFDENMYDNYGRILAYVYYEDEEGNLLLLNEEILKEGLARPLFYEDTSKWQDVFVEAYTYAYENRRGIFEKYDDDNILIDETELSKKDVGKIRWVKTKVKDVKLEKSGFYKIISENEIFYYGVRRQEFETFFDEYNFYDLKGKETMFYGEIWIDHQTDQYEILGRAPFEIK
jgi:micrococcal nuclease